MQNSCSMLNLTSPLLHLCILYAKGKRKIEISCTCEDFFSLSYISPFLLSRTHSMNIFGEKMKGVLLFT
jgi:hypothetical protein